MLAALNAPPEPRDRQSVVFRTTKAQTQRLRETGRGREVTARGPAAAAAAQLATTGSESRAQVCAGVVIVCLCV